MSLDTAMLVRQYKPRFRHWWLGLVAASLKAGALSASSYLYAAGASTISSDLGHDIGHINILLLPAIFGLAALKEFFDYLGKNPLPLPDDQQPQPAQTAPESKPTP